MELRHSVHAYGLPRVEDDPALLRRILDDTTSKYESKREKPWKMDFPEESVAGYMRAIVGFSIRVTRVEPKFKLGQNRSHEDQAGMLRALETSTDPESNALARFIREQK